MITAKVANDAARRYIAALSKGRPEDIGLSEDEQRYTAVLRQLQGKRLIVSDEVQGGVQHYDEVVPDFEVKDHRGKPIRSKVIAIPRCYLTAVQTDDEPFELPVEEPQGDIKLLIVKLLTPWMDGFTAFKRPESRKEPGKMKTCPYCGSEDLYCTYWRGSKQHFHFCNACCARFVTAGKIEDV